MAKAIFHPQAWINDYAVDVDAEGETEFDVGDVPAGMRDNDYPSDELHAHENAPEWVKEWAGPFWIEIAR